MQAIVLCKVPVRAWHVRELSTVGGEMHTDAHVLLLWWRKLSLVGTSIHR